VCSFLCSSLYGSTVWFHFTSARLRDGLASFACRSLTSTSRPSSSLMFHRLLRALVFLVLLPRLSSRLPRRTHLLASSYPVFRFMGRRKLAEREQEKSQGVRPIFFFFLLLFLSIFCFNFLPFSSS